MVLDIITFPAERLRKKAEPVQKLTSEIENLISDMKDTLYEAKGYGLAAPQVGHSVRILVLDETAGKAGKNPRVIINPEFISQTGEMMGDEGCLSVPGEYACVKRFACVTVSAYNEKWERVTIEATEQLARILQHEIDHLNGVLFLDRLPLFKRDTLKKHIKKRISAGDYQVVSV